MTDDVRAALSWVRDTVTTLKPRKVNLISRRRPVVVLTDGACEEAGTTVGGFIIADGRARYFGIEVPEAVAESWRSGTNSQVIGQAELFPVYAVKRAFRDWIKGRDVLIFIDNNSARQALIKGHSPSAPSCEIMARVAAEDILAECRCWYARVPTWSNMADLPSRTDFGTLERLMPAATRVEVGAEIFA